MVSFESDNKVASPDNNHLRLKNSRIKKKKTILQKNSL